MIAAKQKAQADIKKAEKAYAAEEAAYNKLIDEAGDALSEVEKAQAKVDDLEKKIADLERTMPGVSEKKSMDLFVLEALKGELETANKDLADKKTVLDDINKKVTEAKAARDKRVSDLTPRENDNDNDDQGGNGNGESQVIPVIPVATRTVAPAAQNTQVVSTVATTTTRQTRRSAQAANADANIDAEAQDVETAAATEAAPEVTAPAQNTENTTTTTNIEDGETALAAEVPASEKKPVLPWIIAAILAVVGISTEEYMRRKHLAEKAKDNK